MKLSDEDVYHLNGTIWRNNPASTVHEAQRRLRTPDPLRDAVEYALAAYDCRVRAGLSPMGKIDSMELLRLIISAAEYSTARAEALVPDTFVERTIRVACSAENGNDTHVGLTAFEAMFIRQKYVERNS